MLIQYLPNFLQEIKDFKEIFSSLDIEMEIVNNYIEYIVKQSSILNADEDRVAEWENFLRISKKGDLHQRKLYIIATLTTIGKLNKTKIEEIVNIYTGGGGAIVQFNDSTIIVKVKPPEGVEDFRFPDIERTLNIMKPAHLGLVVTRYYALWSDVNTRFSTWEDVKNRFDTWGSVRNYSVDVWRYEE